jgi:hypothetical protein
MFDDAELLEDVFSMMRFDVSGDLLIEHFKIPMHNMQRHRKRDCTRI